MNQKSNAFLETEKISVLMRKYAVPCIISLLVAALYNIVDQIFIANADYLGSYGNAANTVVFPLTVVALAIAVMIGDGCCAFVSICLGANKKEDAHRSIGNAVVLCVISSLIVTAVYLIFQEQILTMFGGRVNEETFYHAREYFFYISIGIPFYMFGQAMNPIIRSDGSPKFAMACTLLGALTNIILDPIFIFVFRWGMMGAAVATVLGQVLTAVLSIWYLCHMKAVQLNKSSFRLYGKLAAKFLPLGICSFLSQISLVLCMAAVQNMILKYGSMHEIFGQEQYAQIPMAVVGIVMKFFQIVISIAVGMAAGCIPIVGYNIGAGRKDRAKSLFTHLLIAEALVGLVAFLIVELLPMQLIAIFGAANESVYYTEFAVRCFRIYLCMMVLATVNKATFIYLQSLGKAMVSTALSMIREVVFGVGFAVLLPVFFGLDGVLYSMPVSDVLTFLISAVVIRYTYRQLSEEHAAEQNVSVSASAEPKGGIRMEKNIITISREFGSGGRSIGKAVAEQLGIPYYDKELIKQVAEKTGFDPKYIEDEGEYAPGKTFLSYFSRFTSHHDIMGGMNAADFLWVMQRQVILELADKGPCVIVGRCADYILQERPDCLHVFVHADTEYKADRIVRLYGESQKKPEERLKDKDTRRSVNYKHFTGREWGRCQNYHLSLNSGVLGEERCVKMICGVAKDGR